MSDWPDLTMRPIGTWPSARTPPNERKRSPFDTDFSQTLNELRRELDMLDADNIVLEVAIPAGDQNWRQDGRPRAHARADHPGVVLEFTAPIIDGGKRPVRYATDRFLRWQDCLRAIVLGLHDLRRLERYGIVERGQQYKGWAQLPSGRENEPNADRGRQIVQQINDDLGVGMRSALRLAIRSTHPDTRDEGRTDQDHLDVLAYKEKLNP